jgi:hypothetical protein
MNLSPHVRPAASRREFLMKAGGGFGALALSYLMGREAAAGVARPAQLFPRAKSVIWLFMEGGPSHVDIFDPKPLLAKLNGQPMPKSFGRVITAMGTSNNTLLASKRQFKQHGQSGLWVSDWHPQVAKHADDLCVIRSCWADGLNHVGSVCEMNTGSILAGRPSMGAWINFGLGSVNDNLPAFVVLTDAAEVNGGPTNWSAGFLPATYQGTHFRRDGAPVFHLTPPKSVGDAQQRAKLDLLHEMNVKFDAARADDSELTARINAYELAYRMQTAAPEAVDIRSESAATKELYGLDDRKTSIMGSNCLLARRLVERGVRFVQVYSGSGSGWDAHADVEDNHSKMCHSCDQPIAGLLTDLKSRGLLDDTLVIWGGEFGRTPFNENSKGRDHNPWGFSMWMAGGGVKGGSVVGSTDEIGLRAQERPAHVSDVHATILYLMGLDHLKLTYPHNGRAERATVNSGEVIREVLA